MNIVWLGLYCFKRMGVVIISLVLGYEQNEHFGWPHFPEVICTPAIGWRVVRTSQLCLGLFQVHFFYFVLWELPSLKLK